MENDCIVQCQLCGLTKETNFSECLRRGWDRHCGYVMKLLKPVEERIVRQAHKDAYVPTDQRSDIGRLEMHVTLDQRSARRSSGR